jgi:calcium-dependent protein kinase
LKRVKSGKFDFKDEIWAKVSDEAKHLIKKMLEMNPSKRYSAQEALDDPWFKKVIEKNELDQPLAKENLNNLKQFGFQSKLQEATWVFLVSYFSTKEEKDDLLKTFKAIDVDHDGQLTKNELKQGYVKIMGMTTEAAEQEAEQIMKNLDTNKSGTIDYTEFVNATISKSRLLKDERLQAAFKVFDRNGDGVISAEEMKFLFNEGKTHGVPPEIWNKWIGQVDQNSDGGVSFDEFKNMMVTLMSSNL